VSLAAAADPFFPHTQQPPLNAYASTGDHPPHHARPAASTGPLRGRAVFVYGYGRVDQAPTPRTHPELCAVAKVLRPGDSLVLGPRSVGEGDEQLRGASAGEEEHASATCLV
jgi:hypothetical protein